MGKDTVSSHDVDFPEQCSLGAILVASVGVTAASNDPHARSMLQLSHIATASRLPNTGLSTTCLHNVADGAHAVGAMRAHVMASGICCAYIRPLCLYILYMLG